MDIIDVLQIAANSVNDRKFRFALNLIGIMIGCAAVTGLVSLTQGFSNNISGQLGALGANVITVTPSRGGFGQTGGATGTAPELTFLDLSIISRIPGVATSTPIDSGGSVSYSVKGNTYSNGMTGVTDQYFEINSALQIAQGRAISRTDSGVAVVGSSIVQPSANNTIFVLGDSIRVTANVNGVSKSLTLRIVGILQTTGGSFGSSDSAILIPINTFDQFYERGGAYSTIQVMAQSADLVTNVTAAIQKQVSGIRVSNPSTARATVASILGTVQAVLGGIAAISLVVAGVGIVNTMTVSVLERTREIGTLKALGARSRDILFMFLTEAALTGIVGGIIGAIVGFFVSTIAGDIIGLSASISISLGLLVVGFSIITCVLSGLYPALHASRMNPVEALRSE